MIARLIGVALLALVVAAVLVAVARPETFWNLDGPTLEASIEDAFGYEVENCRQVDADNWRCAYAFDALSGVAGAIGVRRRGERCWSATTDARENSPSRSKDGCASAWQFFRAM